MKYFSVEEMMILCWISNQFSRDQGEFLSREDKIPEGCSRRLVHGSAFFPTHLEVSRLEWVLNANNEVDTHTSRCSNIGRGWRDRRWFQCSQTT